LSPDSSADYGRGVALTLVGVLLISFEALILRLIGADVWTVIWWRGALLCATVLIVSLFVARATLNPLKMGFPAVIAIISFAGSVFTFVGAVNQTTAANTLVIASAAPALAAVFSWLLLGESVTRSTWLAVSVVFVGVAAVLWGSLSTQGVIGDVFALGYAAWLANYFVALRCCRNEDLLPVVFYGGLLSAVLSAPMASPLSVTINELLLLAVLGSAILPASILLLAFGTRHMPAPDVVLVMMLEALLGPLWVWLALEETPSLYTLAGGLLIVATVVAHAHAEIANQRAGAA